MEANVSGLHAAASMLHVKLIRAILKLLSSLQTGYITSAAQVL